MENSLQTDTVSRTTVDGNPDIAGQIDLERMQDAAGYDEECLKELVDVFLEQTEDQFEQLDRALKENSPETVRSIAHSAVGSSATCGLNPLVGPLRALEKMGKEGNLDGGKKEFERATSELGRIKEFLKTYLQP